jgi:hypothetical protein
MPVVINDFEVIDAPRGAAAASAAAPAQAEPPPLPDEEDLRRLLAEMSEQAVRIWSH